MVPGVQIDVQTAELYSRVPDDLKTKVSGRLEGPSVDVNGNLLCTDMGAGRIYRISPEKKWEVLVEYDGVPNGCKLHKDGRAFIADRKNGLMVLDTATGRIETVLSGPKAGAKFKGLNDLHFAMNGDLYFTDQGRTGLQDPTGYVYRLTVAGGLDTIISNAVSPNGLVLSKRENALYVAVTRASAIWRIELDDPALRAGHFVQLPCAGPDGVALDDDGNVIVAHPTLGAIWVYSRIGLPMHFIKTCSGPMTTNMAYGGPDNRTLFITETHSGSILTARLPTPGRRMFSHS
jgi:gluconolactonase